MYSLSTYLTDWQTWGGCSLPPLPLQDRSALSAPLQTIGKELVHQIWKWKVKHPIL